jgi:hypothetical protein
MVRANIISDLEKPLKEKKVLGKDINLLQNVANIIGMDGEFIWSQNYMS